MEKLTELLAQTLAPRLFALFGTKPQEMGFPIYDTKEEVEAHLARLFDPVAYWTDRAREMAQSTLRILVAGGVSLDTIDLQAAIDASARERPDIPQQQS